MMDGLIVVEFYINVKRSICLFHAASKGHFTGMPVREKGKGAKVFDSSPKIRYCRHIIYSSLLCELLTQLTKMHISSLLSPVPKGRERSRPLPRISGLICFPIFQIQSLKDWEAEPLLVSPWFHLLLLCETHLASEAPSYHTYNLEVTIFGHLKERCMF